MSLNRLLSVCLVAFVLCLFLAQFLARAAAQREQEAYEEYRQAQKRLVKGCKAMWPRGGSNYENCLKKAAQ